LSKYFVTLVKVCHRIFTLKNSRYNLSKINLCVQIPPFQGTAKTSWKQEISPILYKINYTNTLARGQYLLSRIPKLNTLFSFGGRFDFREWMLFEHGPLVIARG
jgi:hypothetical protein